jgi:IrrE N-terminal-like domain
MWLEAGLARVVEEFWEALPYGAESFPRNLVDSASLALPVAIRDLPCLSLSNVKQWLRARSIPDPIEGPDRRLRGCLLAYGGHGFVLIDGSDPDDERRFTIAHELAHFLLDYQDPRRRAIEVLGEEISPVLDNARLPTRIERLHAILSEVPIGLHIDMMERTAASGYSTHTVLTAEHRADRLALELLAPAADAWSIISALPPGSYTTLLRQSELALTRRYGLPQEQARSYAAWLLKKAGRGPGFRDWLGG